MTILVPSLQAFIPTDKCFFNAPYNLFKFSLLAFSKSLAPL